MKEIPDPIEVSFDYVAPLEARESRILAGSRIEKNDSPYSLAEQIELLRAGANVYGVQTHTGQWLFMAAKKIEARLGANAARAAMGEDAYRPTY